MAPEGRQIFTMNKCKTNEEEAMRQFQFTESI